MEEMIKDVNPKMSEVDILYQILRKAGQGQSFRELMQQVCLIKGIPANDPQLMAAVHTQINLDNRFAFLGQGSWGLKEWSQGKVVRRNISVAANRTVPFRRRSLQEELEAEDSEFANNQYENQNLDEEDEWEE